MNPTFDREVQAHCFSTKLNGHKSKRGIRRIRILQGVSPRSLFRRRSNPTLTSLAKMAEAVGLEPTPSILTVSHPANWTTPQQTGVPGEIPTPDDPLSKSGALCAELQGQNGDPMWTRTTASSFAGSHSFHLSYRTINW